MSDEKKLIFSGEYYEAWRAHIVSGVIAQEGIYETLSDPPTPQEIDFLDTDPENYVAKHHRYLRKQEAAKSFVFNRLTLPILNTVRRCKTVRQVINRLDNEYRPKSDAAEAMARRNFYSLRYVDGNDMARYIKKFQECADKLMDAGHNITDREKIQQFISSLSRDYDVAVTNYQIHARDFGPSFETLKRMVIDRFERDFDETKLQAKYSSDARTESKPDKQNQNRRNAGTSATPTRVDRSAESKDTDSDRPHKRQDFQKWATCHRCGGFGHLQPECPSALKKKEETKQEASFEERKSKAAAMMVLPNSLTVGNRQPTTPTSHPVFLLDTGAFQHMTSNLTYLTAVHEFESPKKLHSASRGAILEATHAGEMLIEVSNKHGEKREILLRDVLFVPNLDEDLLSENAITRSGRFQITSTKDHADIFDMVENEITFSAERQGDAKFVHYMPILEEDNCNQGAAYPVQPPEPSPQTSSSETEENPISEEQWLWHRRLGHISGKYLKLLMSRADGIPKLNISDDTFRHCPTCLAAKSTELGHNTKRRKAQRRFEIVSTDIMGPFTQGKNGEKFVATFIDNFSNYTTIALLKKKSDVATAFAKYHKQVEAKFPNEPLHLIRSDRAKEYIDGDFRAYCEAAGVTIEETSPYSPQLNGVAERMNRTITERLRALLFESKLNYEYWPYAIEMAVYLINRSPSRTNIDSKTPFEIWNQYKPDLQYLRTFGCTAYRHIPEEIRKQTVCSQRRKGEIADTKLCPRAEKRQLIGYTATGYTVIDATTGKITHSSDVRFVENEENEKNPSPDPSTRSSENKEKNLPANNPTSSSTADLPSTSHATGDTTSEAPSYAAILEHSYAARKVSSHDTTRTSRPLLEECVPLSYAEISSNPYENEWREAVKTELTAMKNNEVFETVQRTTGMKTIDSKWLFTIKYTDDGEPYPKARLVARGFRDRNEYKINETYSPVINQWLIRWALSIANRRNFRITKFDVSTAFLNADINQLTYLAIPEGLPANREKTALKLHKSLYGLKPSSKNWYDTLHNALDELQFRRSKADRCLYYKRNPDNSVALLIVYVDDILLLTDDPKLEEATRTTLQQKFKITVQPDPKFFVGFEIRREMSEKTIYLSQKKYIARLLQRFQMEDSHPQHTPMETGLKLVRSDQGRDDREYRAMIGCLLYLARGTRPDIAFAVNSLSRLQSSSTDSDKNYVRRIFRYLKGTIHYELPIRSKGTKLEAFVDASYAPEVTENSTHLDLNLGRSVSGYLLRLFGDPILWNVKKQTIVASSSTAAEIIAVHDSIDDIRVAHAIMNEIFAVAEPVIVWEDNTSTTRILMGGEQKRNRSVLIKCYDVLESVHNGEIQLQDISSLNQLADFLTKPLDRDKFQKNVNAVFFPPI